MSRLQVAQVISHSLSLNSYIKIDFFYLCWGTGRKPLIDHASRFHKELQDHVNK